MPLVRIDVLDGWSEPDLQGLLDEVHGAVVQAFEVPARDRYQILQTHDPARMILQDTGLGFGRSDRAIVISVTSRRRSAEAKETFYRLIADRLAERLGVVGTDLLINVTENGDADWSFADGAAQFLTGAL